MATFHAKVRLANDSIAQAIQLVDCIIEGNHSDAANEVITNLVGKELVEVYNGLCDILDDSMTQASESALIRSAFVGPSAHLYRDKLIFAQGAIKNPFLFTSIKEEREAALRVVSQARSVIFDFIIDPDAK